MSSCALTQDARTLRSRSWLQATEAIALASERSNLMAKEKRSFEGQELAPMEPWRPEYAPQAITSRRHPASTIVAFVLAAGFGLSVGGAFANQAGILPPLGSTESAAVADQSPDVTVDPTVEPTVDPTPAADGSPAPSEVPAIDPAPSTDPVVIPPPAGGGDEDDDEDEDEEDGDHDDDHEDEDGDDD